MDKYTPNFMTAPPELTARGIDFLTKVSTSAERSPRLGGDEEVSESFMTQGAMKDGPTYGVMMFRKPRMAEMDQGYTLEDYFLTSPTAVESPFSHRDPTEVGLMTQDQPSTAIKRSEVVDEPVLYGDLNSLLNRVSSGLSAVTEPVARHARQAWDGLSDENKQKLKVAGVAATVLGGAGLTNRYLNSKAGRTMVISRALRSGGGSSIIGSPVDDALVASTYGDADDPAGWANAVSRLAADQPEDLTTQAMLLGAEGADSLLNPESHKVAQIPVDFFRTAYALGRTYQDAKSEPTFAYSFMDGDPLTTALGLKYLKAPACYVDFDGRLVRTAVPYSAPFFMAGGALWDKIKNGIKKIGGKIIDGARKFVNSGIGSALTSIIPWGGAVKTAVNAVGKVKDFIGKLRGKKDENAAADQPVAVAPTAAPATEQLVVASDNPAAVPMAVAASSAGAAPQQNMLVAPPAATVDDAAAAAANANRVEAAKQLIAAAGVTPIDELEGSKSAVDSLPTSWRVAPQQGALGYSLADRVSAITQASGAASGDPLQGFIPALVAYPVLDFLLGAVAQGAAFYGVEKVGDGLLALIKKKRATKQDLPVENASAGDVTSSMAMLQDWLSKSALISATQGSPMAGSVGSALAKLIGKGAKAAASGVKAISPYVKKGAKVIASKLGSAGKVFLRALKKKPIFTIIGSCGAAFVASSMMNRKSDQRRAIVSGVRQTLENLSASGYAEVTDQMLDFLNKYDNILVDSPDQMDQAAKATWEAIMQYCYISLLSLDADQMTPDQRDLCERCQKAGEEMKAADPEAYEVFSNMVGHTIASATGVDPDDEAIAQSVDDADSLPAESRASEAESSQTEATSEAASLLSSLGLRAAAPVALQSSEGSQADVIGDGTVLNDQATAEDVLDAEDAESAQGQSLTPDQESAVEQAASILAIPASSLEEEQHSENAAAQVLMRAGITGASAALILSLIRRKKAERMGEGPRFSRRSIWSDLASPSQSGRDSVRFRY